MVEVTLAVCRMRPWDPTTSPIPMTSPEIRHPELFKTPAEFQTDTLSDRHDPDTPKEATPKRRKIVAGDVDQLTKHTCNLVPPGPPADPEVALDPDDAGDGSRDLPSLDLSNFIGTQ
jgi:hypothetical protein